MSKVASASIWSIFTEIIAKAITPLTFFILTSVLLPSDFGVIAIATNILGFVYIVIDLGVSKVIIQFDKKIIDSDLKDEDIYNSAFTINIIIGVILCLFFFLLADKIAEWYNTPESENVIKVLSLQILLFSFSAIQSSVKKKKLEYKFLFYVRLITVLVPTVISIPLAFLGYGYWAVIYGSTCSALASTIVLWASSSWRPRLYWNKSIFIELIRKSVWDFLEQILIWVPIFLDTYLLSNFLSKIDLGMYTVSKILFSAAIALLLTPVLSVLFSFLSMKNRDNSKNYNETLIQAQKYIFIVTSLLGIGVYCLRNIIEDNLFNSHWYGIGNILGIMFLITSFSYIFIMLNEGIKARGYFKEIALNTFISVILTSVSLFLSYDYGIITYVIVRSFSMYYQIPGIIYLVRNKLKMNLGNLLNKNIIFLNIICLSVIFFLDLIKASNNLINSCVLFVYLIILFKIESNFIMNIKRMIFSRNLN